MTRRVVVVGAGLASAAHLTALRSLGAEVLGVVTRNPARAEAAQQYAPAARICSSISELTELGADTGVVVTPPSTHLKVVSELTAMGLDVIVDKPLAGSLRDAKAVADMAEATGVRVAVSLQHRYKQAAMEARRMLSNNEIGALRSAVVTVPLWRPDSYYDEQGRGTWARDGGGVLMTQAIHTLDVYLSLTEPVTSVVAAGFTSRGRLEAEDTIHLILDHGGYAASVTASTASWPGGTEAVHLYGDKGQLAVVGDSLTLTTEQTRSLVGGAVDASGPDPLAMAAWFEALYRDVFAQWSAGNDPMCEATSALHVHQVIDAAYRSAAQSSRRIAIADRKEKPCP
ncbi:Gfo/Idh/MocA family protein [Rhodococcoides fascians]|uniref:Gfo/Idh/MocA family protein n=1 Tax=Rhodococcoides fascians TaxID=1828 RepID=UPI00050CC548|nr:Gfo/Idh/MocA family oxidoreductase [Rhodococcus fascians]